MANKLRPTGSVPYFLPEKARLVDHAMSPILAALEKTEFGKMVAYYPRQGGKRIRPALCMLSCEALGGDYRLVIPITVALEFCHNYGLVHDDIEDQALMRRGTPTLYSLYGLIPSIEAGDALFAKAVEVILDSSGVECPTVLLVLREFAKMTQICSQGQFLDYKLSTQSEVTIKEYLDLIYKKTAVAFETAAVIGARVASASEKETESLAKYGKCVGMAFQIRDDVLDFAAGPRWGKAVLHDIEQGKRTLPIIHALASCGQKKKKLMKDLITKDSARKSKEDILAVAKIVKDCRSLDYASRLALGFVREAKSSLTVLRKEKRGELLTLANFAVTRKY